MEPVGVWEWFGLILLLAIPGINLITIIVVACGVGKPSMVNFCRGFLLWGLVGAALSVLLWAFPFLLELLNELLS